MKSLSLQIQGQIYIINYNYLSEYNYLYVFFWKSVILTEAVVRRCSVKKDVLRNFAKFTGKRLCQSLFFNKVGVEKRHLHRCFPVNFPKFLRTPLLKNTSGGCFWHFQTWCYEKEQNKNYSANLTTIKCGLNENKIDQWQGKLSTTIKFKINS